MSWPKTFVTKRLLLKPVTEADIPAYERHFLDYEVIRHLSAAVPWPYPEGGVADFVHTVILPQQGKDKWVWGIFLLTDPDELIGIVDLWREGSPENRGFWLGRRFWRQGLMTEAVTAVMDYAFTDLGFEELVFSNAKGNVGSRMVKVKTGATLLRTEPAAFVDPVFTETEIWLLKKEDWFANRDGG